MKSRSGVAGGREGRVSFNRACGEGLGPWSSAGLKAVFSFALALLVAIVTSCDAQSESIFGGPPEAMGGEKSVFEIVSSLPSATINITDELGAAEEEPAAEGALLDFLNVSQPEAQSLGTFLDVPNPEQAANCTEEDSILGALLSESGELGGIDLTTSFDAVSQTSFAALLEGARSTTWPEAGQDFKYVAFVPTNQAWTKLRDQLEQQPSEAAGLRLEDLIGYHLWGTANETEFSAITSLLGLGSVTGAPYEYVVNVPIDMLDGNLTVLSIGSTEELGRKVNGYEFEAEQEACNGLVVVIDEVLLPGAAVEQYLNGSADAAGDAFADSPGRNEEDEEEVCDPDAGDCCDIPPPSPRGFPWTCEEQKQWNKCTAKWMWDGRFCESTCGFCGLDDWPYAGAYAAGQKAAEEKARREEEWREEYEQAEAAASEEGDGDGEYEQAEAEQTELSFEELTIYSPCACTPSGLSGEVFTGIQGCSTMSWTEATGMRYASAASSGNPVAIAFGRQFGSRIPSPSFQYCYVVNPSRCSEYTEGSETFPGARWRFC